MRINDTVICHRIPRRLKTLLLKASKKQKLSPAEINRRALDAYLLAQQVKDGGKAND